MSKCLNQVLRLGGCGTYLVVGPCRLSELLLERLEGIYEGSHLAIVCASVEVYTVVKEAICIAHTGTLHLIDTIMSRSSMAAYVMATYTSSRPNGSEVMDNGAITAFDHEPWWHYRGSWSTACF